MLTIEKNGEKQNVGYSCINRLTPNPVSVKCLIRDLLFEVSSTRATGVSYSNMVEPSISLRSFLRNHPFNVNVFTTGELQLLNSSKEIVGIVSLYQPTLLSGDATRGTLNDTETYSYASNNKQVNHIVVDFPTNASNSDDIKYLKLTYANTYQKSTNYTTNKYTHFDILYRGTDLPISSSIPFFINKDGDVHLFGDDFIINCSTKISYKLDDTFQEYGVYPKKSNAHKMVFRVGDDLFCTRPIIGSYKKLQIVKLIFNDIDKTVTSELVNTLELEYSDGNDYSFPILFKETENGYKILLRSTYDSFYGSFLELDKDFNYVSQTSFTSIAVPFANYRHIQHFAKDEEDVRVFYNTATNKCKVDFANNIISIGEYDLPINSTCDNNTTNFGECDIEIEYSDPKNSTYMGYGYSSTIRKKYRNPDGEIDYALFFTLDEPITKTDEQTLKITLDVAINS